MNQINIKINDLIVPVEIKSHIYDIIFFLDVFRRNYALCKKPDSESYYLVSNLKIEDLTCECQEELSGGHKQFDCENCIAGISQKKLDEYINTSIEDNEAFEAKLTEMKPFFEIEMNITKSNIQNFFYPPDEAKLLLDLITKEPMDILHVHPSFEVSWEENKEDIITKIDSDTEEKIDSMLACDCESCETVLDLIENHDSDDRIKNCLLATFSHYLEAKYLSTINTRFLEELEQIGEIEEVEDNRVVMTVDLRKILNIKDLSFFILDYFFYHGSSDAPITKSEVFGEIMWSLDDENKHNLDLDSICNDYPTIVTKELQEYFRENFNDNL